MHLRYFFKIINLNPSFYCQDDQKRNLDVDESGNREASHNIEVALDEASGSPNPDDSLNLVEGGKKHPTLRRQELLVNSGLAKVCCLSTFALRTWFVILI